MISTNLFSILLIFSVEAVGISILLGACVDYPAHVIERFVEIQEEEEDQEDQDEEQDRQRNDGPEHDPAFLYSHRKQRVVKAMTSVGVSVLNASATTVCSCGVLVFCTVQVFNRVGMIMLTASAVSMTATLVLVPTVLALCGPVLFERGARLRMKVTFLVLVIAGVTFAVVFVINNAFGRVLF